MRTHSESSADRAALRAAERDLAATDLGFASHAQDALDVAAAGRWPVPPPDQASVWELELATLEADERALARVVTALWVVLVGVAFGVFVWLSVAVTL